MARKSIKKNLYVAYGSNLHVEQMSYRCPDAKVYGSGVLKNYSLTFWGNSYRSGVATVVPGSNAPTADPAAAHDVPVVVWEISARDEASLDRYEGFPHLYRKEDIEVTMDDGSVVAGMIYLMNEIYGGQYYSGAQRKMRASIPSDGYYETIATGYKHFGFDLEILILAREQTITEAQLLYGGRADREFLEI